MTRLVVGVLGHVDHGKTALVRALTGMETDRLEEERQRGISIVLGFAHFGAGDAVVDLVDMPGHERFVRTMVSGATGIGAVLLAVAANEGVMPQTCEHVDIAGLLGLRRAVVAVTKADLVPPAQAAAVGRDAAGLLARAGLGVAPIMAVSAATGQGIEALRQAITALRDGAPPPGDDGFPFLPVDRAFSVPGHGTVVTGTLRRGALAAGDTIEVAPGGLTARIRGLQVHGARVAAALPGQRVAANLRGVEVAQVGRGVALTAAGLLPESAWLSVDLRALDGAPPLRNGTVLHLLLGTAEVPVRLRLLDRDELAPGAAALAQLHCTQPVATPARERFILRTASPALTVAGGMVLDPATVRLRRGTPAALGRLAALAGSDARGIVAHGIVAAGGAGMPLPALARLAGVAPGRLADLLPDSALILPGQAVVARDAFDAVLRRIPALLAGQPAVGLPRDGLQRMMPGTGPAVLDAALARLAASGAVQVKGGLVGLPRPDQDASRARTAATLAARLSDTLRRAGLSPPDPAALAPDLPTRQALDRLVREGAAIRVADRMQKRDVVFHRDAVDAARRVLAPLLAQGPGLRVAEAGAALGISRKYSVPLLEHLDAMHFTRRIGDRRVLAQSR